ncbi:MAG TPA: hypothetical protein DCQ58_11915 [Saprospirales bacterium]|nr:hypothetical protein [Saprospirales bacterium]
MIRLSILISIFFIVHSANAVDTLRIAKPISLDKIGIPEGDDYLLIQKKAIQIPHGDNNRFGFFNYFDYSRNKFSYVLFRNCFFNVYELPLSIGTLGSNSGFYVLDSCEIEYFPIVKSSGTISINSSLLKFLTVEDTRNLQLQLLDLNSISYILIDKNSKLKMQHMNCSYADSASLRIYHSSIDEFDFAYDERSGCDIYFVNDTLNRFIASTLEKESHDSDTAQKKYPYENKFYFKNCYINTSFVFFEPVPNSVFVFDNCTFGSDSDLDDLAIDKLVIKNCQYFPEQFTISFREKSKKVDISLVNVNLDNIRMDILPNMRLVFDSEISADEISNSYFNLLEKFRKEGKDRSYRIVDLQYREWKGGVWNFIAKIWWNYGYDRGRVFLWTIGFICLFLVFNFFFWPQITGIYNPFENIKKEDVNQHIMEKLVKALVYTLFVFFAIIVDFKKIRFTNPYLIIYILCQHVIGILCILFIVEYVFKL